MDRPLMHAVTAANRFVQGHAKLEPTLQEVSAAAVEALRADMAGLTMRDERGRPTTVVYTDVMVPEIDQVQYDYDRGPCVDAARTHTVFEIEQMDTEERWPDFAEAARRHGIRSSLSMPVVVANNGLGALNFYDSHANFFNSEKRELAALFAAQCATVGLFWSVKHEADTLANALESRAAIEQAKGVIMGTTGSTPDEAFALLREQSQRENRKLRDIAEEIVARQKR